MCVVFLRVCISSVAAPAPLSAAVPGRCRVRTCHPWAVAAPLSPGRSAPSRLCCTTAWGARPLRWHSCPRSACSPGAARRGPCPAPAAADADRESPAAEEQEQPLVDRRCQPPAGPPCSPPWPCAPRRGHRPAGARGEGGSQGGNGSLGAEAAGARAQGKDLLAGLDGVQREGLLATARRNQCPRRPVPVSCGRMEHPGRLLAGAWLIRRSRGGFVVRDGHPPVSARWFLLCSPGEVAACQHRLSRQLICSDS